MTTADRLLDAQVAWVLGELIGDRLLEVIERDVDELLLRADEVRLAEVASSDAAIMVLDRLLATLPASAAARTMARATADQVHDGPAVPVAPAQLVDREQVAALVDATLAMRPLLAQVLDRLTASPRVGTLASGFITRLVVDVLEANRSMAKKIPGVGSIVSMGTNAATRMVGVADKQVQALLGGETGSKGTAMAVRRLNSVVLATLDDPSLRDAVLEVWDTYAGDPVDGIGEVVDRDDVRRLAAVVQDIAASAAPSAPVREFLATWVQTFVDLHGDRSLATLMEELGLTRDDVVLVARTLVPPLVAAARDEGRLEQAIRGRLEPFFHSAEVAAILEDG